MIWSPQTGAPTWKSDADYDELMAEAEALMASLRPFPPPPSAKLHAPPATRFSGRDSLAGVDPLESRLRSMPTRSTWSIFGWWASKPQRRQAGCHSDPDPRRASHRQTLGRSQTVGRSWQRGSADRTNPEGKKSSSDDRPSVDRREVEERQLGQGRKAPPWRPPRQGPRRPFFKRFAKPRFGGHRY